MSTVKISQLPLISQINANTSNTLFAGVDIPTGATGKMTAHTLAQGLYSNEVLNVGVNQQNLPNTIAQFALAGESYIQTNLVNTNDGGTADIVVTANVGSGGSDSTNFIDMGWANKNYQAGSEFNNIGNAVQPNDGYLYVQGTNGQTTGNLVLGTTSTGTQLKFTVGGGQASNIVARFTSTALVLNTQSHLTFSDGSNQYVAAAPANYTQSAFDAANTNAGAISVIQGVNVTQNTNLTAVNQYAASAYNLANTNVSNILGANAYSLQVNQYAAAAFAQANVTVGVDATQNTNITAVNQFAASAYNTANNALANTTGTFAGDLTTTGNVTTNFVRSKYNSINDNAPLASFVATASGSSLTPSNSGYIVQVVGREGIPSRIALDAIGTGAVPNYLTRHVRGVANTPTPTQSGDIIGRFSSFGYGNTTFNTASDARIDMGAIDNFTDSAHGTIIQLYATPAGANVTKLTASFGTSNTSLLSSNTYVSGNLSVAGSISTGNLGVTGTANVSGTFNVVGVISGNAQVILSNTNFSATESALTISASPTIATPANDGYMMHISGKNGVPSRIVSDSYGTGAYSVYASRTARGTVGTPLPVQSGDIIGRFSANGYGNTKFQQFGTGRIDFIAVENYTDANTGSQIKFWNCPTGSNTLTNIMTLNGDSASFTGVVNPTKGFIYTPNVLSGITTTLNLDIANNSLYSFKTNATTTINLSNFQAGKVVEVWLTNTDTGGGSNHTITHGCYANNSTIGATSFTLTSLHSAYIRYFSIDGDLANTYCQISYS